MGGRAWARGRRLEGRCELGQTPAQLQHRLLVQPIIRVGRVGGLFGGRRDTGMAGAARGRGGLGADDGCRAVDLAEVRQRDLCPPC